MRTCTPGSGAVTAPYYAYHHSNRVVPNETCPTGSSSIAGLEFEFAAAQNTYPAEYDGALFFADYSRDCIWAMPKGADGKPAPGLVRSFVSSAANPVNLENGPGGDLFYVDFDGGTIRRITYTPANQPPGGRGDSDPDDRGSPAHSRPSTAAVRATPRATRYRTPGTWTATVPTTTRRPRSRATPTPAPALHGILRVTDNAGASATDSVTITVGNTRPPRSSPHRTAGTTWKVGDVINFSGSATDTQDGTLPASALTWELNLQHCPSNCHTHQLQTFVGVANGSFTAPDHEYPSYLELTLTATDSGGLTNTKVLRLDPKTVALTFQTTPGGLSLVVNGTTSKSAFTRTVIVGSTQHHQCPVATDEGPEDLQLSCHGPIAAPRPTTSSLRVWRQATPPASGNGPQKPGQGLPSAAVD